MLTIVSHHRNSPYALILCGQGADNIPTVIGTAVIYENHFEGDIERLGNGDDSFDKIW